MGFLGLFCHSLWDCLDRLGGGALACLHDYTANLHSEIARLVLLQLWCCHLYRRGEILSWDLVWSAAGAKFSPSLSTSVCASVSVLCVRLMTHLSSPWGLRLMVFFLVSFPSFLRWSCLVLSNVFSAASLHSLLTRWKSSGVRFLSNVCCASSILEFSTCSVPRAL